MAQLRADLYEIVFEHEPATVRGIYYQAVPLEIVPKTENGYKTISRVLTQMRMDGELPFEWIVDNTRWMRKPTTYSSMAEAARQTARLYRRDLWSSADATVEIWCEKDALAGVLYDVTEQWDVALMVNRGFSSVTYLHEAAASYKAMGKPTWIYYFGDSDSYGLKAEAAVERKLRHFAPEIEMHFERAAVTEEQVAMWNLPTRPDKATKEQVVEVDAIAPRDLRALAEGVIRQHVDLRQLDVLLEVERNERDLLMSWSQRLGAA